MKEYTFGDELATICLVEIIGEHNLDSLEEQYHLLKESMKIPFQFLCFQVENWNQNLTPWVSEGFEEGADRTLEELLEKLPKENKTYYLGGYSLAGLFALWVSYQTDFFSGIVAASPSVWYPGWDTYIEEHECKVKNVYLSLGTKEHKTKHPLMRNVKKCIILQQEKCNCVLEMNPGNHFTQPNERMVKGFLNIIDKVL